ncbi:N-acetylglucosaminyl-phosphatidylinositol de-N-acetylase-like [Sphaeramia orbicularis]|uniref:N-acetylglucosaminylphosphatidylinositol deacetylase n=2 Tax=Sphaeramia orbicularis TaxID=375764 RepID=A0A673BE92_9TELE|nr:N-acetylglucosaminyl-phosphatidylinositol de-N-acetylase-like [Sphaeramia orbicularis]
MLLPVVVSVVLLFCVWMKWAFRAHRRRMDWCLRRFGSAGAEVRVLVVTAHPDDECMFFGPSIIRLTEEKAEVHLLCLSEGNYYNQGSQRREELLNSCSLLGIPQSRVTLVDHRSLPDDPTAEWSISLVSSLISKHIKAHSFNMVLTFDSAGVSGHSNHVSIFKAVSHLASSGHVPDDCCLLSLDTVGLFRKYVSVLDLPLSWTLSSSLCVFSGLWGYRRARDAMLCHRSQLLWFRHLYMVFSRYMFVNTFQMIPRGPRNLRIY